MKSKLVIIMFPLVALMLLPTMSRPHCEIPCGIYDDAMRYDMLVEDILTIEKSMDEIIKLSSQGEKNYNQLVRWVVNKEEHANKIMEIIGQYFLNQRLKPVAPDNKEEYSNYIEQLTIMHQILIYAMKCKQTTDKTNTEKLRELVSKSRELYFAEHGHEH